MLLNISKVMIFFPSCVIRGLDVIYFDYPTLQEVLVVV
jgi:hypothetical protein